MQDKRRDTGPHSSTNTLAARALLLVAAVLAVVPGVVGAYIGFAIVVVIYDGWAAALRIPHDHWGFPTTPAWLSNDSTFSLFSERTKSEMCAAVLTIAGYALGVTYLLKLWHRLVQRLGWMSAEQADNVLKGLGDY